MNFSEIKELIKLINDSDLSYFEMQDEKDYVKIDKSISRNYINGNSDLLDSRDLNKLSINNIKEKIQLEEPYTSTVDVESDLNLSSESMSTKNSNDDNFDYIKSPIVGTYYKALSPTSEPLVNLGQKVKKGETVCIIEAMKLMNEISAEFDLEIISILGEDGKMVEYGQPLFKVRRV